MTLGPGGGGLLGTIGGMLGGLLHGGSTPAGGGRQRMSTGELIVRSAVQSAARSLGTQITRAVLRNVLGGMRTRYSHVTRASPLSAFVFR